MGEEKKVPAVRIHFRDLHAPITIHCSAKYNRCSCSVFVREEAEEEEEEERPGFVLSSLLGQTVYHTSTPSKDSQQLRFSACQVLATTMLHNGYEITLAGQAELLIR